MTPAGENERVRSILRGALLTYIPRDPDVILEGERQDDDADLDAFGQELLS